MPVIVDWFAGMQKNKFYTKPPKSLCDIYNVYTVQIWLHAAGWRLVV